MKNIEIMRRIILLFVFALSAAFVLKAERIIDRERYTIRIPYDTVYCSEDYDLYVKIKSKDSAAVYFEDFRNNKKGRLQINDCVAYLKVMTYVSSNADHTEGMKIYITFSDTTFIEMLECYVKRFDSGKYGSQNIIDSMHRFTSSDPRFRLGRLNISQDNNKKYGRFNEYISGRFHLNESLGQLSIALIVDPKGRVVTVEVLTNTYKTVDMVELNKAIKAYRFKKKHPKSAFEKNIYVKNKNNVQFSVYFKTVQFIRSKKVCSESFVRYNDWL